MGEQGPLSRTVRPYATLVVGLALASALAGCAASGTARPEASETRVRTSETASPETAARAALAERLGTAPSGGRVELSPAGPLAADGAIVGAAYTAASGHRCRGVTLDDPAGVAGPSRIVCRDGAGRWYLPRKLVRRTL